jgi:hypothetical protein
VSQPYGPPQPVIGIALFFLPSHKRNRKKRNKGKGEQKKRIKGNNYRVLNKEFKINGEKQSFCAEAC